MITLICPPWMLLAKPFFLKRDHDEKNKQREKRGGDFELIESSSRNISPSIDIEESKEQYNKIELTHLQLDSVPSMNQESEKKSLLSSSKDKAKSPTTCVDEKYILKVLKQKNTEGEFNFNECMIH